MVIELNLLLDRTRKTLNNTMKYISQECCIKNKKIDILKVFFCSAGRFEFILFRKRNIIQQRVFFISLGKNNPK